MVLDTLEPLGYKVIEAFDGENVLEAIKKLDAGIDLLLTDVIMPGMSGKELADTLKDLQPDVKVVFMSGNTDEIIAHEEVLEPGPILSANRWLPASCAGKYGRSWMVVSWGKPLRVRLTTLLFLTSDKDKGLMLSIPSLHHKYSDKKKVKSGLDPSPPLADPSR